MAVAIIAQACPLGSSNGNSIHAQHDPVHHTPCIAPKTSASVSAARPKPASARSLWHPFKQVCFAGEHCQMREIKKTVPTVTYGANPEELNARTSDRIKPPANIHTVV
jgi:hypothetical protein